MINPTTISKGTTDVFVSHTPQERGYAVPIKLEYLMTVYKKRDMPKDYQAKIKIAKEEAKFYRDRGFEIEILDTEDLFQVMAYESNGKLYS